MSGLPHLRGAVLLVAALAVATTIGACSDDGDGASASPSTEASAATASGDDGGASGGDGAVDGSSTGDADADASPVEAEELAEDEDLYATPDPIPDVPHGTLLRYQEVTPSLAEGATTYRVMYTSESLAGEPIVVTGSAVVPDQAAPEGGRPVLTIAHGTTGIADECAPSKDPSRSEGALAGAASQRDWIIATSDYEGLGTPGRHPYLVGESEGRSVVDAALAAARLPDAGASDQLLIAGYSQGGHGALFAREVAPEWAPDLEVVGTFAGAPATEIDVILNAAPRLPQAGFAYMIIAGMNAAYPDQASLDAVLTPEGLERIDAVDEGCARDVFAAVAGTPPDELVKADGLTSGAWRDLAVESNPGQVELDSPVLIVHSQQDDVVPVALSAILFARMCDGGQDVERRVLDEGTHTGAAGPAYGQGIEWLAARLDGAPTTPSCDTP